jgi:hypothetical protein
MGNAADALTAQEDELEAQRNAKDGAYWERNNLVALLSKVFPAGKKKTAIEGWSEDWHGCVYIDLPTGQASWHYHDSQAHLFDHLPEYQGEWDGHTTGEKYERLAGYQATAQADRVKELDAPTGQEPFEYLWEPDGTFNIGQERQLSTNTGPCIGWKITPLYLAAGAQPAQQPYDTRQFSNLTNQANGYAQQPEVREALTLGESEVEDFARSAYESAMAFGIDLGSYTRLAKHIWHQCLAANAPPSPPREPVNQVLVEALKKLARLGNGEHYGNSDGNMIARAALDAQPVAQQPVNVALLDSCKKAQIAITDWLHQYASELCDSDDVADSRIRIANAGGTIAYIADICEKNSIAIATAEQAHSA